MSERRNDIRSAGPRRRMIRRAGSTRRPQRGPEQKAAAILRKIAADYPSGVDSLFSGANLRGVKRNGRNMAAALRRGDISAGKLYDHTIGAFSDLAGSDVQLSALSKKAGEYNQAGTGKDKTKFENIMNTLLGTASQAVDIYNKARNPQAGQAAAEQAAPQASGTTRLPWLWIAAGLAVVVILAFVFIKKKK